VLQTHTSNLTPDQQQRLHGDFLANEQAYLHLREGLLPQYQGQWVAVHEGKVIAAGPDLLKVTEAAAAVGGHPYIARVGAEADVVFRVRHAAFAYDQAYQPFPLPQMTVTFWNHAEPHSQTFSDVVPDTGADLCVLPTAACQAMNLFSSPYFTAVSSGVSGASATTLIYWGKADLDGRRLAALIELVAGATERKQGQFTFRTAVDG
jgi:hypothetical protein